MGNILISYDPSNGDKIGEVTISTPEQIREKVSLARKAAIGWKNLGLHGRLDLLKKAWAGAESHIPELAQLMSREMGKNIQRSSGEANGTYPGCRAKRAQNIAWRIRANPVGSSQISVIWTDYDA